MEGAEEILVVILSGTLAVFLILGIVALVKIIQILNHMKRISEKAEKLADSVEHIGEFFRASAGPVALGKLLSNIADSVFKRHGGRSKRGKKDE